MDKVLIYSAAATLIVSLMSFAGIFFLAVKEKLLNKIILSLVGFSAGALLGGAFFHLLPEVLGMEKSEGIGSMQIFMFLILGIIAFYLIERVLKWHHCHEKGCDIHTFTYMSLIGDSIHNFIDGLVIYSAFAVNTSLGIVTTIMIVGHEIPQEIGDFAVLIYGGFGKVKALLWNFITALAAVIGAVIGYFIGNYTDGIAIVLLPFAAGGFLYIAMSDLIPELHKEVSLAKSLTHFLFFICGILFMWAVKVYAGA